MNSLVAKCGATGFKSPQGLKGHERMCPKCQQIDKKEGQSSTSKSSTQKPENKGCQHHYIPLTAEEKARTNDSGVRLGDLCDFICKKCGDLK